MPKTQRRLLLVTTVSGTLSGFLLPYADHFRSRGWVVDGAARGAITDEECRGHFDTLWEIPWSRRPWDPGNLRAARQLQEILASQSYDIVHVHTPVAGFVTRLAAGMHHLPAGRPKLVYTAHGFHCHPRANLAQKVLYAALEKIPAPFTDALIVINREDERLARRLRLAGSGRLCYMPGIGVDLEAYSRANVSDAQVRAVRTELGLGERDHLFLIVAALMPGKRHRDALRALAELGREDIHLALAGVGPQFDSLRHLADTLGVSSQVHLLSRRNDIPVLLAASKALILPSEREGLPRSVLEAMALGTPVIGARIRGTAELLEQGTGILVEVGDMPALARAMEWVVENHDEAAALAQRAQRRVRRYALPRLLELHEELYEQLLSQRGPAPARGS